MSSPTGRRRGVATFAVGAAGPLAGLTGAGNPVPIGVALAVLGLLSLLAPAVLVRRPTDRNAAPSGRDDGGFPFQSAERAHRH